MLCPAVTLKIGSLKPYKLFIKPRGVPMCMQKRTCIQVGAASIGFLDTQFNFWKKKSADSVNFVS